MATDYIVNAMLTKGLALDCGKAFSVIAASFPADERFIKQNLKHLC